jgi:hypothetical protein
LPKSAIATRRFSFLFFFFLCLQSARMTRKLCEQKTSPAYHAIFHIIIIRLKARKIFKKEAAKAKEKKLWKYNKKIFLLISLQFFASPLPFEQSFLPSLHPPLKGCQKQAFPLLPDSNTSDTFSVPRNGARRRLKGEESPEPFK